MTASTISTLRVFWVVKELSVGGAERLLLELQPHLPRVDFVPIAVREGDRSLEPMLVRQGLTPIVLGNRGEADLRWALRFRKLLGDLRPDVVHFHAPYPASIGRIALLKRGCPILHTEHSDWHRYHPLTRWANRLTYSLNDRVIAVSEAVRDSIMRAHGGRRSRGKVRVILNGIDTRGVEDDADRQGSPDMDFPGPTYGTVGHLRHRKGIDVLLRSARQIQGVIRDARCIVVGGGEDAEALHAERRRLAAHSVSFLGVRQDARALLGRFDVFVIASRVEGLPLALLEAMSLSKPIVATRVGGIPDVLRDGHDAILVEPDDAGALATAIVRLLEDRELASRLARNARTTVENRFSARATAEAYEHTYRELAG